MESDAGGPAIGIAGIEIQCSGIIETDWIAFREKLQSVLLSPPSHSTGKTPNERDGMSQFEAQCPSTIGSKELWSQFQAEACANKTFTTNEMLKLKHPEQQPPHHNYLSNGCSKINAGDSSTLISAVKPTRYSESDISWRRRFSFGSASSSVSGGKNEYTGPINLPRRRSSISNCLDDESCGSFLPFLTTKTHDLDDYCQAIRGNTQNVLSLYGSLSRDNKASSTTFARMFQTLKEGFEQKQVERQQQCNENRAAVLRVGIPPMKTSGSVSPRSALKPSRFSGSHVGRQRRASWGVGITTSGKNEFLEVALPGDYEKNNASDSISTIRPPSKVTIFASAQSVTHAQPNKESATMKSSQEEEDSDFNSSDEDDKRNNGCFEYYPCVSRQKSLKGNRSSAASLSNIASSLLVEWSDEDDLNNRFHENPCQPRRQAVEKSTRSSVTSWSSVGSSLLVEWGDADESSDDSD